MCINIPQTVVHIEDKKATMSDGRIVRISLVPDVQVGDCLEVYGDIALAKIDTVQHTQTVVPKYKKRRTT